MPKRIDLRTDQLAALRKSYAQGLGPTALARKFAHLGLDVQQITRLAHRNGWGRLRRLAENIAVSNEREIMKEVLGARREEFAGIVESMADSFAIDAEKLRDAWGTVENAADASSLMRAKKLFAERFLSVHGLDKPDPGSSAVSVNLIANFHSTFEPAPAETAPVNVTPDESDDDTLHETHLPL